MNQTVINWLFEGPDWLKYAVRLQLLAEKPDPQLALCDPAIVKLTDRLKDSQVGLPALRATRLYYNQTGNAIWDLFFLADIGLTAADLGIGRDLEAILAAQAPDGTFLTERGMMAEYFCISAILLSTIARLGYRDDPHLRKYLQHVLSTQQRDGGWHCEESDHGSGKWSTASCPMDNLNILMLVGQYEELCAGPKLDGAVDLLLHHWESREQRLRLDGFGVGRRYMSLKYPAVDYGILRVLDALSHFPHALRSKGFASMFDFVRSKAREGRYTAESASGSFPAFDFDQTGNPSRWLTFLVTRVENRAGL